MDKCQQPTLSHAWEGGCGGLTAGLRECAEGKGGAMERRGMSHVKLLGYREQRAAQAFQRCDG